MTKWISQNLPWIATTLTGVLMGFAAGQVKVTGIEHRLDVVESRVKDHDAYSDRLCRIEAIEGIGKCKG